jgi:CBS domain-containing protein
VTEFHVSDLMVPLSEYATVPEGATLYEAVLALEQAQEQFEDKHTRYRHRAILVLNKKGDVIGKVSQMDVLRALEPGDHDTGQIDALGQFGFSPSFVRSMRKQHRLKSSPLADVCRKASKMKVEDVMQAPAEGEYIDEDVSLDIAILQLTLGQHLGLLVTREKKIVGVLRLSDAFAAVFHTMKECELTIE